MLKFKIDGVLAGCRQWKEGVMNHSSSTSNTSPYLDFESVLAYFFKKLKVDNVTVDSKQRRKE